MVLATASNFFTCFFIYILYTVSHFYKTFNNILITYCTYVIMIKYANVLFFLILVPLGNLTKVASIILWVTYVYCHQLTVPKNKGWKKTRFFLAYVC